MALVAVNNSIISITADSPCILIVVIGVIPGGTQTKLSVDSAVALLEADLNTWAGTYVSAYSTTAYPIAGAVIGTAASSVTPLSTVLKADGTFVILASTTFQLDLSVTAPASIANPVPPPPFLYDPITVYSAQCAFTSVIQTKLTAA